MSSSFWRPNDAQKHAILLLEALGLIHDLGKLSDNFLQSQAPSSGINHKHNYNHNLLADPRQVAIYQVLKPVSSNQATDQVQEWLNEATNHPCAFSERADLTTILNQVVFTDWAGVTYTFAELVPLVARPGLNAISPNDWQTVLNKTMQPGLLVGMLHGVAHIEKEGNPKQFKQPYTNVFRSSPFGREERIETITRQELSDALMDLPLGSIQQITSNRRQEWLAKMRTEMRRGLADNRRPHNEVSLWDWGYIVASMTKAAATYIFKNGWPADLNHLPFRILRINLNRLEYYTRCDKISDLLGVRQASDDAFEQVRKLLEESYALGNCIYSDETGAYYLLADLYSDAEMESLRQEIQKQFPPDLRPQVHWGEQVTAGQLDQNKSQASKLIAEPRQQALREPLISTDNNLYRFETEWGQGRPKNAEICTVCGIRPVGYPSQELVQIEAEKEGLAPWATQDKARQRNICRICLNRRGRRAQQWVESGLSGTIWTDEVADNNGRLALFVGKLGLEGWLDGALLSTINVTQDKTKIPSPARLYRIAETARAFWEQVSSNLTPDVVKQRPFRLALYPDQSLNLGDFHAYELNVDGTALSVVWDTQGKRFLTADNLDRFIQSIQPDQLPSKLQGRTFEILEPSEFGQSRQILGTLTIKRVEILDGYYPYIPLLAEPSICLMLVPADKSLALTQAVKRNYEVQMGKVRDRLPLYLGLIYAHRRTPIRAVLEAGRTMLNMAGPFDMNSGAGWEGWRLVGNKLPNHAERELVFDNGITWRIPILTGDCSIKDEWYPRLYEGDNWAKKASRHVEDLRERNPNIPPDKGWKTWVRPSRFDFTFLDTTARRFEIHYDEHGRRPCRTRPFYLEDLDRLEQLWQYLTRLNTAQRHQVIRTIEDTREMWYGSDPDGASTTDPVFRQFVADTLAGAEWPKSQPWSTIPAKWQDNLIQAGCHGELADLAELYMEILKA